MNKKVLAVIGSITVAGLVFIQQAIEIESTTPDQSQITIQSNGAPSTEIRAAVIKDGKVIGVVIVPPGWPNVPHAWIPPQGTEIVLSNEARMGDDYDGESFSRIELVPEPVTPTSTPN